MKVLCILYDDPTGGSEEAAEFNKEPV